MDMIELVEEAGYTPKRKAATHGGEYSSPCPFCRDGDDRFLIWPKRHNKNGDYQGGRYTCRVCGKYGDAINFLRDLHGLPYAEACKRLKLEPKKKSGVLRRQPVKPKPLEAIEPPALWKAKASVFVEWCNTQLLGNPEAMAMVTNRGITRETIERFKLGYNPKEYFRDREHWGLEPQLKEDGTPRKLWLPSGIVIPTSDITEAYTKVKVRRSKWVEGDKLPKYVEISGSKQCPSVFGDTSKDVGLILESELDAILVQQCASDICYCVALGGSTKPLDLHTDRLLRKTPTILFCPDFDKAGAVAWSKWKGMFPHIRRILTPDGKGAGDAYLAGVDLREWISLELDAASRAKVRFK